MANIKTLGKNKCALADVSKIFIEQWLGYGLGWQGSSIRPDDIRLWYAIDWYLIVLKVRSFLFTYLRWRSCWLDLNNSRLCTVLNGFDCASTASFDSVPRSHWRPSTNFFTPDVLRALNTLPLDRGGMFRAMKSSQGCSKKHTPHVHSLTAAIQIRYVNPRSGLPLVVVNVLLANLRSRRWTGVHWSLDLW